MLVGWRPPYKENVLCTVFVFVSNMSRPGLICSCKWLVVVKSYYLQSVPAVRCTRTASRCNFSSSTMWHTWPCSTGIQYIELTQSIILCTYIHTFVDRQDVLVTWMHVPCTLTHCCVLSSVCSVLSCMYVVQCSALLSEWSTPCALALTASTVWASSCYRMGIAVLTRSACLCSIP